jgi:hypothetical protein
MKKIVRLTESDLVRLVQKVIAEQRNEGPGDTQRNDADLLNTYLFPTLLQNGFRKMVNPTDTKRRPCSKTPKRGEVMPVCCVYLFKGQHETGTNVQIDCGNDGFSRNIVVYKKGNQNTKSFDINNWKQAVSYALSLK